MASLHREFYYGVTRGLWNRTMGVEPCREPAITISLTSMWSRLQQTHQTVETLLRQSLKPTRIVLWLTLDGRAAPPYGYQGALTPLLQRMQHRGLEVRWTPDLGPHTKLLPALKAFPGDLIVTADDDVLYGRSWLSELYEKHVRYPDCVVCHRGKEILFDSSGELRPYNSWTEFHSTDPAATLFPLGRDGILYPPGSLSPQVFDEAAFRRLSPAADDVWFKAMSLLRGALCVKIRPRHRPYLGTARSQEVDALNHCNVQGGENDGQIKATFSRYGLKRDLIEQSGQRLGGSLG